MDYSEQLQDAIEECLAFVVLVTDTANKSPYVRAETEMAFCNSKPIFPVRLSDIKPAAGLAFFLKIRHWTDAYGKARDGEHGPAGAGARDPGARPAPARAAAPAPTASRSHRLRPPAPPQPAPPSPPPAAGSAADRRAARARRSAPMPIIISGAGAQMDATGQVAIELELGGLPRQFLLVRLSQDVGCGGDRLSAIIYVVASALLDPADPTVGQVT